MRSSLLTEREQVIRDCSHTAHLSYNIVFKEFMAEEHVKGVADDVESEAVTECEECEEQFCSSNTTSEENLKKGISKNLSNIKRMILRNEIAQFLLNLSTGLSEVMELCSLDIPTNS